MTAGILPSAGCPGAITLLVIPTNEAVEKDGSLNIRHLHEAGVAKSIKALNHKDTKAQRKTFLPARRSSDKPQKNFASSQPSGSHRRGQLGSGGYAWKEMHPSPSKKFPNVLIFMMTRPTVTGY